MKIESADGHIIMVLDRVCSECHEATSTRECMINNCKKHPGEFFKCASCGADL